MRWDTSYTQHVYGETLSKIGAQRIIYNGVYWYELNRRNSFSSLCIRFWLLVVLESSISLHWIWSSFIYVESGICGFHASCNFVFLTFNRSSEEQSFWIMEKKANLPKIPSEKRTQYPIGSDQYTVFEEIGKGVSALVHRALCIPLNEIVAIKILDFERDKCDLVQIFSFFFVYLLPQYEVLGCVLLFLIIRSPSSIFYVQNTLITTFQMHIESVYQSMDGQIKSTLLISEVLLSFGSWCFQYWNSYS